MDGITRPAQALDGRNEDAPDVRESAPTIERNGSEYLVTINGAVFVALSLAQARAFAERMRSAPRRLPGARLIPTPV